MARTEIREDIQIRKGQTATITGTIRTGVSLKSSALDLTGAAIYFKIAKNASSSTVLLTKSTADDITISSPSTSGVYVIDIASTDFDSIDIGSYYYEIYVVDSSNNTDLVTYGNIRILDSLMD